MSRQRLIVWISIEVIVLIAYLVTRAYYAPLWTSGVLVGVLAIVGFIATWGPWRDRRRQRRSPSPAASTDAREQTSEIPRALLALRIVMVAFLLVGTVAVVPIILGRPVESWTIPAMYAGVGGALVAGAVGRWLQARGRQ